MKIEKKIKLEHTYLWSTAMELVVVVRVLHLIYKKKDTQLNAADFKAFPSS